MCRRPALRKSLAPLARAAALLAALLAAAPPASAQSEKHKETPPALKLSVAVGPSFALGKAGERWGKLVAEKTGGTLAAQVFPGASLAQRDPALEFPALRDGAVDLAVGSSLNWAGQVSELALIGLPWIAPDARSLDALVSGEVRARLDAAIERAGVVPLAIAVLGHRALATVVAEVRVPEDLAGLAVRVTATPLLADLFTALGAQPRAMAFAEAEAAFRSGSLQAQEGTLAAFAATRLDALGVRRAILWGAIAEVAVFAASRALWGRCSDAQRAALREAAEQAAQELPALARTETDAAIADLGRRGFTVTRVTPVGHAAFAAAARPVYDKWARVAGEELVRAAEAAIRSARR